MKPRTGLFHGSILPARPASGPSPWPRLLCAKLTRNMSREEWRSWVSPEIDYVCQCPGLPVPPSMTNQAESLVCKAEGG
jgi:hypothetical protein